MELSRIKNLLAGNTLQTANKNTVHQAKKTDTDNDFSKSLLQTPDKLFNMTPNNSASNTNKTLLSLNFGDSPGYGTKLINENTRVLHIGDSHTAGIYGNTMDKMMRETGAKVLTIGSSGSSPSSWVDKNYITKSGLYYNETGKNKIPPGWEIITPETAEKLKTGKMKDWQIPTRTPHLPEMIDKFKPNVIVFSLGANLLGASGKTIEDDVRKICEIAKAAGAKIVWVGPPDGRPDKKTPAAQSFLYDHIQKVAAEYGTFIDSRPYTDYPAGDAGDGVHYQMGREAETAKKWSRSIFDEIQK